MFPKGSRNEFVRALVPLVKTKTRTDANSEMGGTPLSGVIFGAIFEDVGCQEKHVFFPVKAWT